VVKVLGAAYLIWLGVKQWRAPVTAAAASGVPPPSLPGRVRSACCAAR
jgi:threonine/homoserine/homoserine lactone efflux protein